MAKFIEVNDFYTGKKLIVSVQKIMYIYSNGESSFIAMSSHKSQIYGLFVKETIGEIRQQISWLDCIKE